jgi:hypothetical protein
MSDNKTKFWTEDITILFKTDRLNKIIPTNKMTRTEQFNAITRFCIYYIILLYIVGGSYNWIKLPMSVIVLVIVIYYIDSNDNTIKNKTKENMADVDNTDYIGRSEVLGKENIEIGVYDDENNVEFDLPKRQKVKYSLDEIDKYRKATCKKPTKDNPFMNPLLSDINKEIPVACNSNDDEINDEIENKFNKDLYRDVGDLYNIKNSQRQFYTVPVTSNPPDTTTFAKWLYKVPATCKEDQERCLRYQDLRYKN